MAKRSAHKPRKCSEPIKPSVDKGSIKCTNANTNKLKANGSVNADNLKVASGNANAPLRGPTLYQRASYAVSNITQVDAPAALAMIVLTGLHNLSRTGFNHACLNSRLRNTVAIANSIKWMTKLHTTIRQSRMSTFAFVSEMLPETPTEQPSVP